MLCFHSLVVCSDRLCLAKTSKRNLAATIVTGEPVSSKDRTVVSSNIISTVGVKPSFTPSCSGHVMPCIVLVCSVIATSLSASCSCFCSSATFALLCPAVVLCPLQQ